MTWTARHALMSAGLLRPQGAPWPDGLIQAVRDAGRLDIHRNHLIQSLATGLRATFPITLALVGEDYFHSIARGFVLAHPPQDPRLYAYGAAFSAFLAARPELAEMPFLADVAALEHAMARVQHAVSPAPDSILTPERAVTLGPVQLNGMALALSPTVALVEMETPADLIWERVRDGGDLDDPTLRASASVSLLIWRDDLKVLHARIEPALATLLGGFGDGAPLEIALAETFARHPRANPQDLFIAALTRGLLIQAH